MKAGHRGRVCRGGFARAEGSLPHASPDARELVFELHARGPLAPAAAATAAAVPPLVQRATLAPPIGVETQPEDARAVGERIDVQPARLRTTRESRTRSGTLASTLRTGCTAQR